MHRLSFSALVVLAGALVAGCDGSSSKSSDRASATAPITSSAPTTPGVPTARVTGRVTHQGAPVAGAFLILASTTTGETPDVAPGSLFSDASGAFAVDAPLDVYDVIAVTTEGLVAEARLDLSTGAAATLDLHLAPVAVDPSAIGPGTLQRLLSAGPLEPDASLLTEDD
jgi:hypothetical protein